MSWTNTERPQWEHRLAEVRREQIQRAAFHRLERWASLIAVAVVAVALLTGAI